MTRQAYFRRQAQTCLDVASASREPAVADTRRLMAAEFLQKATDLEAVADPLLVVQAADREAIS
jgi:hypothetical protein